jgi:hypothetical protein
MADKKSITIDVKINASIEKVGDASLSRHAS